MEAQDPGARNPLATLLDLAHRARHADDAVEIEFLAVNATHALAPYRQAVLWCEESGVRALSGVVQIEANAPYTQWIDRVLRQVETSGPVTASDLPAELRAEWEEWLPQYALLLPLAGDRQGGRGALLLARDIPWMERETAVLTEWADILRHALKARRQPQRWSLRALRGRMRQRRALERESGLPWWRRRNWQVAAATLLVLACPVRLTVLAPGSLVPSNPASIRSPLDGVIERFRVAPNQLVKAGQPLFDFDQAQLDSRYAVALQALSTAEAEYRQALQQALTDTRSKAMLSTLQGKIEERRAETDYLGSVVQRASVTAPRDGIVLFDDPSEWSGRPVQTGERIMRIAVPDDVEVEAWLSVGDAIPLAPGAPVSLYLSASPLEPVGARVRYVSYDAIERPDGSHAYRVRATLTGATVHRVGLKGTAKLSAGWVPMAYWIMRRPLAAIRQTLGV